MTPNAHVWYYQCDACGPVWNVPKNDPRAAPQPVTAPRNRYGAN